MDKSVHYNLEINQNDSLQSYGNMNNTNPKSSS